jgi:DNA-binding YbaB/EbfC family protein
MSPQAQIPGGGAGGMEDLLRQAQKMQRDMGRVQDELKERVVEGKASGGLVSCMINGSREVVSIKIDEDAIDEDDPTILEDLVIVAVNNALKKAEEMINREMKKVSGGMNLPGMM